MNSIHKAILEHPRAPLRENHYYRWYPKSLTKFGEEFPSQTFSIEGVYIHIPFCDKICTFCPFIKGLSNENEIQLFTKALLNEIKLYGNFTTSNGLSFINFGGGTPSVLNQNQIAAILNEIDKNWSIDDKTEISLETHPTHASIGRLKEFKKVGVNRISMGIQSFNPENLILLGASHDSTQSHDAVKNAGIIFENFAIDLLYSFKGQSMESWQSDVDTCLNLYSVPHISCYPIIPTSSKITSVGIDDEIWLALSAIEKSKEKGLYQYASCSSGGFDISIPGKECKYERGHWGAPQAKFIGFGPGAFGYLGKFTSANIPRTRDYITHLLDNKGFPLISLHEVSQLEQRHRYFSLGVKTYNIPFDPYIFEFHEHPAVRFQQQFNILQREGLANITSSELRLTEIGKLFVDDCSAIFFSESEMNVPHPEELEIAILNKK